MFHVIYLTPHCSPEEKKVILSSRVLVGRAKRRKGISHLSFVLGFLSYLLKDIHHSESGKSHLSHFPRPLNSMHKFHVQHVSIYTSTVYKDQVYCSSCYLIDLPLLDKTLFHWSSSDSLLNRHFIHL